FHSRSSESEHVFFCSELEAASRAGLDASGLQANLDPVNAEGALGHLAGLLVKLGDVERAARFAEPTTDALLRIDVDDPVLVLHNGARGGARRQTTRISAVHALVFAHQPSHAAADLALVESDQVPVIRR